MSYCTKCGEKIDIDYELCEYCYEKQYGKKRKTMKKIVKTESEISSLDGYWEERTRTSHTRRRDDFVISDFFVGLFAVTFLNIVGVIIVFVIADRGFFDFGSVFKGSLIGIILSFLFGFLIIGCYYQY